MIVDQTQRQRADEIMAQMVSLIHHTFPDLNIDVYPSGPEREDGLLIVHVPNPDFMDEVRDTVGQLQVDAIMNEGLLISVGSQQMDSN
ncbi:MAG: hypothetical protein M3Z04_16885 [Chloroflexota bacterium]|nr:hypothetical protein [Chloroflexota bacterium]